MKFTRRRHIPLHCQSTKRSDWLDGLPTGRITQLSDKVFQTYWRLQRCRPPVPLQERLIWVRRRQTWLLQEALR